MHCCKLLHFPPAARRFSCGTCLGVSWSPGGKRTMRLSRILMLIGALALPALPAAAQGKALGKPAGVGKPTTTVVKGASTTVTKGKSADAKSGTLVKGNSADHPKGPKSTTATDSTTTDTTAAASDSKGRGQLPLG